MAASEARQGTQMVCAHASVFFCPTASHPWASSTQCRRPRDVTARREHGLAAAVVERGMHHYYVDPRGCRVAVDDIRSQKSSPRAKRAANSDFFERRD